MSDTHEPRRCGCESFADFCPFNPASEYYSASKLQSAQLNPKQALAEARRRWPSETWSVGRLPKSPCVLLVSNSWSKHSHTAIGRGATWEGALQAVAAYMEKV